MCLSNHNLLWPLPSPFLYLFRGDIYLVRSLSPLLPGAPETINLASKTCGNPPSFRPPLCAETMCGFKTENCAKTCREDFAFGLLHHDKRAFMKVGRGGRRDGPRPLCRIVGISSKWLAVIGIAGSGSKARYYALSGLGDLEQLLSPVIDHINIGPVVSRLIGSLHGDSMNFGTITTRKHPAIGLASA